MKFVIWIFVLAICIAAEPLQAEMLKSTAKAKAIQLWGSAGMIGDEEYSDAKVFTRKVGVHSGGCSESFTVLGSGATWDLAFVDYTNRLTSGAIVIAGPFRGIVQLRADAWDEQSVAGFQYYADSKPWGPEHQPSPALPALKTTLAIDTSQMTNGLHVLCSVVRDNTGNIGRSAVMLFRTDQRLPLAVPFFAPSVRVPAVAVPLPVTP